MLNRYPLWKNLLLIIIIIVGCIYALPNLYGEEPSVQISGTSGNQVDATTISLVKDALATAKITPKSIQQEERTILVRLTDTDSQLKAKDSIKAALGDQFTVALNLASATPPWLKILGAQAMKLGLDLRGGVHFSLDVDVNAVVAQRQEGQVRNIQNSLREANIRYVDVLNQKEKGIIVRFREVAQLDAAYDLLHRQYPGLLLIKRPQGIEIIAQLSPTELNNIRQYTVEQTMTTLRNRVNELGISEALVQQQGADRVAVDLPGIQDTARAQEILGGTATLEFRMVDQEHDPRIAATGNVPIGSQLYTFEDQPILLKTQVILTGNSITNATTSFGEDGRPSVNISLGGGGEALFHRVTGQNIGKLLAIVYVETKVDSRQVNGQIVKIPRKVERIISAATIKTALPNNFQITGLRDPEEARNLALLLRAGALPAPITIAEERTVGPSLGMENIHMGVLSVIVGMALVIIFMALYYSVFGLIADLALAVNMVLLVALLSILGMTLTLPGIAGIVLTVGMAVDANVLIFERIREELRNGVSPQAAIHAGYERAFSTIVDANLTTLIVALVLFSLGTGSVKGFAVTLSLGLLTSMLSAITFTRALVNWIYGGRTTKRLAIGI